MPGIGITTGGGEGGVMTTEGGVVGAVAWVASLGAGHTSFAAAAAGDGAGVVAGAGADAVAAGAGGADGPDGTDATGAGAVCVVASWVCTGGVLGLSAAGASGCGAGAGVAIMRSGTGGTFSLTVICWRGR